MTIRLATSRSPVWAILTCLVLIATASLGTTESATAAKPASLDRAVRTLINHSAHRPVRSTVVISQVRRVNGWAYGNALVPARSNSDGAGVPTNFIAHRRHHRWRVGLK